MKRPSGYWNYENCYNEAKKYKSRGEFSECCDPAYRVALRNKWLDDYVWLESNKIWTYQSCLEESKKYTTRSEFAAKRSGAYHVACKNGWLDDYTWLPSDARLLRLENWGKWTEDACYAEAKKHTSE